MNRTWVLVAIGVIAGAGSGWLYWHYFGCTYGCAITSSPVNSNLYGALMGALLIHSFKDPTGTSADPNNP